MKKLRMLFIVAALLCSAMILGACGNSGEAEYKVTVKDVLGNTYGKEVIVEFYKDGEKVAMQVCDENGIVVKSLAKDTYEVKLRFTDNNKALCYEEGLLVTSKETELEVLISNQLTEEPTVLYADGEETEAYNVSAGCTRAELSDERNYFLFAPIVSGTYEISIVCDGEAEIGYYGAPHFVQTDNVGNMVDGKIHISISDSMIGTNGTGTTIMVLGVDVTGDVKEGILCINRIGDPEKTIEDLPWTIYETTSDLSDYKLPDGATLVDFDVTASDYKVVYNEEDGFYHLNDANGPLIVVYLSKDPQIPYLPCFKNILDRSGISEYIMNEDDEVIEKISYSECLLEYIDCADKASGVYPLTEDLKHIIQARGNYVGWWDSTKPDFVFVDLNGNPIPDLNTEIAWLFMCAYVE